MKTEHINKLLHHPASVSGSDVSGLHQLVESYPWCQSFQVLYTKALKESDDPRYNHQLKKTAVYATDRKILYRLLMQEGVQQSIATFNKLTEEDTAASEEAEQIGDADIPEVKSNDAGEDKSINDDITAEPKTASSEPDLTEKSDSASEANEEELLDAHNLEQEVLKEVAARAYALQFESQADSSEEKTEQHEAPELPNVEPSPEQEPEHGDAPMSFVDFITGKKAVSEKTQTIAPPEKGKDEEQLIDRFISNEPKIERRQSDFFSPVNMGKMSLVDSDELVTETLAEIYAKQGDTAKAKRAYQQLTLKYPEKSIYFASLIKKLEQSKSKK